MKTKMKRAKSAARAGTVRTPMLHVWVGYRMPKSMRRPAREFYLVESATFDDLHHAIQDACGWQNRHAWAFRDTKGREDICGSFPDMPDAKQLRVVDVFATHARGATKTRMHLHYLYDWGDSWWHDVHIARVNLDPSSVAGIKLRQIVHGSWSFPPEDCGGFTGYARILEFLETGEDPWGEDVEELRRFIGTWKPYPVFSRKQLAATFDR